MIHRIRKQFIRIALAVLSGTILLIAFVINLSNWFSVRSELAETLNSLSDRVSGPGSGPADAEPAPGRGRPDREGQGRISKGRSRALENRIEESRYFLVSVSPDGSCTLETVVRDAGHTDSELTELAEKAVRSGREKGFSGEYLYRISGQKDGTRTAVFLNCATRLQSVRSLVWISLAACFGGILIAWILVSRLSWRAIRPMAENSVQQQQFITDAGHELKTPLTVISANMDLLASEKGDSEWIRSTRRQVSEMRNLVQELIDLSRMEESSAGLEQSEFDLSRAVLEAAEPFSGMADYYGKSLDLTIPDGIRFRGNEAAIRRLVSVLLDNAVKYAPDGDRIRMALSLVGRKTVLTTENQTLEPLPQDTISRLFDRFYRPDSARSRDGSGGSGIGLAIARAVVEKHGGQISVRQDPSGTILFRAVLPTRARQPDPAGQGRQA